MDKFFDLFSIFRWIEILRLHRKGYQNFIFNFEDIWKRKIENGFQRKVSDTKVTEYFLSVNIFITKQSMLLTFLWLLKIDQVIESSKKGLQNLSTDFLENWRWAFSSIAEFGILAIKKFTFDKKLLPVSNCKINNENRKEF